MIHAHSRTHRRLALALGLTCLLFAGGVAHALSVPGMAGVPANAADNSCFNATIAGAVQNAACGPRVWRIPLAVNEGTHTVSVAANNGNTGCQLIAVNQTGSIVSVSTPQNFTSTQVLSFTATQPNSGSTYFTCNVGVAASIFSVNYSQ